jgi:peroxiredoxin
LLALCLVVATARGFAQQPILLTEPPTHELTTPPFSDAELTRLTGALEQAIALPPGSSDPAADPELQLWKFTRWLQSGELSHDQETRVEQALDDLASRFPSHASLLANEQRTVQELTVGKVAPEISGRDLDGRALRLSDFRGKVVVLTFSGDWCGICRAQYPYQRLLQDLYRDQPFAIVSVNSDTSAAIAREAKANAGLSYRTWWDGYGTSKTDGPIAASYNIYGWPTTYVLDERGVIRFVDLRQEDLLKGVRQLMTDLSRRTVLAENAAGR